MGTLLNKSPLLVSTSFTLFSLSSLSFLHIIPLSISFPTFLFPSSFFLSFYLSNSPSTFSFVSLFRSNIVRFGFLYLFHFPIFLSRPLFVYLLHYPFILHSIFCLFFVFSVCFAYLYSVTNVVKSNVVSNLFTFEWTWTCFVAEFYRTTYMNFIFSY